MALIDCNYLDWEKFCEGIRRRDVGPFTRKNKTVDKDSFVEFWKDDELVACMCVYDSNTDKPGTECTRQFQIKEELLNTISYIYIPTDEQWQEWDDEDEGTAETNPFVRAAEYDAGWLR